MTAPPGKVGITLGIRVQQEETAGSAGQYHWLLNCNLILSSHLRVKIISPHLIILLSWGTVWRVRYAEWRPHSVLMGESGWDLVADHVSFFIEVWFVRGVDHGGTVQLVKKQGY